MRSFRLRRDLGLQLLALYLLFVGLVIIVTLVFENFASQRLEADVKAADLALARAIAQETSAVLNNALESVENVALYPAVIAADADGMDAVFRTLMDVRNNVNLVYRLDETGEMLFHFPLGPASTVGDDFSFRDYFQAALNSDEALLSKGRISPTTNQPVATAVMPLRDENGRFQGVVATNLMLESLSSTLVGIAGEYAPTDGFQVLIVDASGQIIAHTNPDALLTDAGTAMPAVITAVLANQNGNLIANDVNGEEQLYSYMPIERGGWGVIVSRPTAVAFASPSIFQRGALIAVALFLIGGIVFWLIFSERVIRPVERLAQFSQIVGLEEQFSDQHQEQLAALTTRPDQMGMLTRSMTDMQQAIEARLNELSTLVETSQAVVSSLDSATVLANILEQVERLLGVQMSAVFAQDAKSNTFRIQASRNLPAWFIEEAVINPKDPSSITMRALRSKEAIQISDTETNPSLSAGQRERAHNAGYRSVAAVPLLTQHAAPSALLVFRPDPHEFSTREMQLLANFGNQAAMAIENATLYARSDMRLQVQTRRLESLIQSMQDGLILEDLTGRVLYANRRVAEWSGLPFNELRRRPVTDLMNPIMAHAKNREEAETAVAEALRPDGPRKSSLALEIDGRTTYLRLKIFDVTDAQGIPIGRGRILQDITQRHEVDRMKSSLISTVSHELRTPLAAIKGYATTLLADDVEWDPASQQEFLGIISEETDHLSVLVNDLLDMSRIEAGNLTVSRLECHLADLVKQAAARAHPPPEDNLQIDLPPDLSPLFVDPRRIETVLRNLIENAVKYGGDKGAVTVTAVCQDHEIVVKVIDEGPGIPQAESGNIFSSFYRGENGLTRQVSGVGLGLSIARGFVQAHGGDIWTEPQEIGTCIAFSLPLDPLHNVMEEREYESS
jgi:PAS domain S-box-containing protein